MRITHRGSCGRVVHGCTGRRGGIAVDPEEGRPGSCTDRRRGVPVAVEAGSEPGGGGGARIRQSPVVVLGRPLLHLKIIQILSICTDSDAFSIFTRVYDVISIILMIHFLPTSAAAMEVVVGGQCVVAAAGVLLALCCAAEANWKAAPVAAAAAAVVFAVGAVEVDVEADDDVVAVEED